MTDYEFRHSTLRSISERKKILEEQEKYQEDLNQFIPWDIGRHVRIAITSSFDKKIKYPDNPLSTKEVVVEDMELSEDEKQMWLNKWFGKLEMMGEKHKTGKT